MSAWEEETRENLKSDADRCVTAIRLQLLILMEALENTDERQAIIRTALRWTPPKTLPRQPSRLGGSRHEHQPRQSR